ncbi:MAG TPA: Spy/CpxP family protein refolding chaperone [Candidatus Binatia bacterium]
MHPGMMYWWKTHRGGGSCHAYADDGPAEHGRRQRYADRIDRIEMYFASHHESDLGAGVFGVRRPLRFLAYKLELDERQVAELARILGDLKTERAQAEVDRRRATAALADAVGGEQFDAAAASNAGAVRVATAEHMRDAVVKALQRLHALLEPAQRERLAYLIRTGTLQM